MPKKILHAKVGPDKIRVENTWLSGANLYLNDDIIGSNNNFFALDKKTPFITADAFLNGETAHIEVFAWAILTVKLQIRVNGEVVSGEEI